MAGGDLGNLWFSLGIKDNVSKQLNGTLKEVQKLEGLIGEINKRIVDLKQAGSTGDANILKGALNNALDYLHMLQKINSEREKIADMKAINKGVDISKLEQADKLLQTFKNHLLDLQSSKKFGGVDTAVIGSFSKSLRNTLTDVNNLKAAFSKENSLSSSANNAAQLTRELERVKNKLQDIYALQSNGMRKGFDTGMLFGGANPLRGVQTRINNILRDPALLADETKYKQLISDVALAMTKAEGATRAYAIAKEKSVYAAQKQAAAERQLQAELTQNARAARELASAFSRVHDSASKTSQVVGDLKSMFLQGGLVFGAQQFANSVVQTGGEIVQQHIALRSILSDVQKADTLFAQTQQLALQSPFKFGELNRDVKQLAAFGVEEEKLYETTRRLADIASGLGVSFERLGLAYGQTKARSWLDGKELRQFAYAGLPMLQRIAELYNDIGKNGRNNYTTGDIKNMITKRQVSFEDVDEVLKRLTNEGGQFYNMQFVLSETLLGRWNKLIDAWDIMLGKFADGKNVLSQTFMAGINATTELVLQLDRLSPALLSFGAMFAGKRLFGGLIGKATSGLLIKEMGQAQTIALKSYATQQMERVMQKDITAEMAKQNIVARQKLLNTAAVKDMSYMQLAAEGRISAFQVGQLARRGEISMELIKQLQTMNLLTAKEAQLITLIHAEGNSRKGNMALMQLGAGGIGSKIGGLFTKGNIAMIAASVALSLWMGYKQWSDKVKEDEKALIDSAKQHAKTYKDFLSGLGDKGSGDLQQQVDSMKNVLKSSGDYTDSIKAQVENAKSLSEQYDILKDKIKGAKDVNDGMSGKYGSLVSGAYASTGLENDWLLAQFGIDSPKWVQWIDGVFNDDIEKNVEQATASIQKYQLMFDQVDENTQASMERFISNVARSNEELSGLIQGLPISEQVRMLAAVGGDDWDAFVERFGNGSSEIKDWLAELQERAEDSSDDVSEIVYDDVPKILGYMSNELKLSQEKFKIWAAKNPEIFAAMMDNIAQKANITSKEILTYFHRSISGLMNFNFWPEPAGGGKGGKPVYRSGIFAGTLSGDIRAGLRGNGTMGVGRNIGEYDKKLRKVQDSSFEKNAKNIQTEYKNVRNEHDIIRSEIAKNKNASEQTRALERYLQHEEEQWENIARMGGVSLDVGKNKATGHFGKNRHGSQKDELLDVIRNRIELYKRFFSEYDNLSKYKGKSTALKELSESGDFGSVFRWKLSDVTNFSLSIDQLTASLSRTTEAGRKLYDDANADKSVERRKKIIEDVKSSIEDLNAELEVMNNRYEIYKKIVGVTGNKEQAENIAFQGAGVHNTKELLRAQMSRYFGGNVKTADTVLGYDREVIKKNYGLGSEIGNIWQKNQDNQNKELKEADDLFAEIILRHQTIQEQIDAENRKYERNVELLEQQAKARGISPDELAKRRGQLADDRNKAVGDLRFKEFKENNGWEQIFRDLDRVSIRTTDKLLSGLRDLLSTNDMSEEGVKAVIEAMDKLLERQEKATPFASISRGYGVLDEIRRVRANGTRGANGGYVLSREQASRFGLRPSKNDEYSEDDLNSAEESVFKGMDNSVKSIIDGFQSLQTVLQPVVDLFDVLGNKGIGEGMNIAGNAFGAASSVAGGLSSLKNLAGNGALGDVIGKAGPWGAAAAAGLSIGSQLLGKFAFGAAKNKTFEKQAEYLKGIQSVVKEINGNLKEKVSSAYGSQAQIAAKKIDENLKLEAKESRETYYRWSQAHTLHKNNRNRMYAFGSKEETSDAFRQINGYLKKIDYNGPDVGGDTIQNLDGKYLEQIREHFAGIWAKLPDQAAEYLNRIIEIEKESGEIKQNAEAMAKAFTDMDLSSLKSEWADLLNSLDSDNEDFADSFEKHMRNAILQGMVDNLYKDRISDMIKETSRFAGTEKGNKYVDKYGNVKVHTGGDDSKDVASEYTQEEYQLSAEAYNQLAEEQRQTRDVLAKLYGWSDSNSNSKAGSNIKGITETQADLLASYLNAIRLDVSVDRPNIQKIADAVGKVPELSGIAQSQLNQLTALVGLAQYRNEKLDNMYDWMRSVTKESGTKHLSV